MDDLIPDLQNVMLQYLDVCEQHEITSLFHPKALDAWIRNSNRSKVTSETKTETHLNGRLHSFNDEHALFVRDYCTTTLGWYKFGLLHRDHDEPAYIVKGAVNDEGVELSAYPQDSSGVWEYYRREWSQNGLRHREIGPAYTASWITFRREIEYSCRYYRDDLQYTPRKRRAINQNTFICAQYRRKRRKN